MRFDLGAVPVAPFRCYRIGDVAEYRAPRQQRVALENHGAVEAGALDRLPIDNHRALARLVEPGEDVQHRGLAAAGVADHAAEFAARHRKPEIFEYRDLAAIGAWIAFCDAFDGDEFVRVHAHRFRKADELPRSALRGVETSEARSERVGVT